MALIGQNKAAGQLAAFIKSGRIPPAMVFAGPKGVGKSLAALEFAKALNCRESPEGFAPCGACRSCADIDKAIHQDVVCLDFRFQAELLGEAPEKQKHIKIEAVRELTARAQQKALSGGWKVFIIDNAETMQSAASNALLKFLEEPPDRTLWILVTSRKEALLGTIKSRSVMVDFAPLSPENVEEILAQQSVAMEEAEKLAALSEGSVDRAVKVKEVMELLSGLDVMDPQYPLNVAKSLPPARDVTMAQSRDYARLILELLIESAYRRWLRERNTPAGPALIKAVHKLFSYRRFIDQNVSPQTVVETALMEFESLKLSLFPQH